LPVKKRETRKMKRKRTETEREIKRGNAKVK